MAAIARIAVGTATGVLVPTVAFVSTVELGLAGPELGDGALA